MQISNYRSFRRFFQLIALTVMVIGVAAGALAQQRPEPEIATGSSEKQAQGRRRLFLRKAAAPQMPPSRRSLFLGLSSRNLQVLAAARLRFITRPKANG